MFGNIISFCHRYDSHRYFHELGSSGQKCTPGQNKGLAGVWTMKTFMLLYILALMLKIGWNWTRMLTVHFDVCLIDWCSSKSSGMWVSLHWLHCLLSKRFFAPPSFPISPLISFESLMFSLQPAVLQCIGWEVKTIGCETQIRFTIKSHSIANVSVCGHCLLIATPLWIHTGVL